MSPSIPITEVQGAVCRYLASHPAAADGVTGIQQWWLPDDLREVSTDTLRAALAGLVERGALRRTCLLDGTELYALNERPL